MLPANNIFFFFFTCKLKHLYELIERLYEAKPNKKKIKTKF